MARQGSVHLDKSGKLSWRNEHNSVGCTGVNDRNRNNAAEQEGNRRAIDTLRENVVVECCFKVIESSVP